MLWRCLELSDDDDLKKTPLEDELSPIQSSGSRLKQEEDNNDVSVSRSFSKFAWHALKDFSLQQVLETSQTYIQSHLKHHRNSWPTPKKKNEPVEPSLHDRDMAWSMFCLVPNNPNVTLHNDRHNQQINSTTDNLASETSMPQSLLDDILDECDRTWAMNNVTKTTNDGFSALSRDVLSRGIRQRFEETHKKMLLSTDDGMRRLANDSMRRGFKHVVIEDEPEDCVEGVKVKRLEQSNDEEETQDEGDNEEGKEAKHQVANHYMLDNLNQQILEHNVTPAFVSPISSSSF